MFKYLWKSPINTVIHQKIRARMSSGPRGGKISFGPFEVTSQVFLTTPHSFALVNLKPLLPGHVLVCPSRPHRRLTDLSLPEVTDLFATVQRVQRMLARHYFPAPDRQQGGQQQQQQQQGPAGSFNIAVQDGPEAGQTVAHVHVHVIPRVRGLSSKPEDTAGDELYEQMAREEGNVGGALWDRQQQEERQPDGARPVAGGAFDRIEDAQRKARSMEEMVAEAEVFRRALREMEEEEEEEEGGNGSRAVDDEMP
ncbi:hypothetical protein KVR01_003419 [Diaporthe batatas]|uniref:bis(5'-adenosyl)-triphosphatase n=1 Tax=Diaporthe batatas TaxID=748121 RepID=UPI001D03F3A9|nr:bis(5'-adenosyl)-triphosphatase [Diaporthe batatas]KAG8167730.1 hypothetical protein KVR01_003419 [Diaporthe batatas]